MILKLFSRFIVSDFVLGGFEYCKQKTHHLNSLMVVRRETGKLIGGLSHEAKLMLLKTSPHSLRFLSSADRNNMDLIKVAFASNPYSYKHLSRDKRLDPYVFDCFLAALKGYGRLLFEYRLQDEANILFQDPQKFARYYEKYYLLVVIVKDIPFFTDAEKVKEYYRSIDINKIKNDLFHFNHTALGKMSRKVVVGESQKGHCDYDFLKFNLEWIEKVNKHFGEDLISYEKSFVFLNESDFKNEEFLKFVLPYIKYFLRHSTIDDSYALKKVLNTPDVVNKVCSFDYEMVDFIDVGLLSSDVKALCQEHWVSSFGASAWGNNEIALQIENFKGLSSISKEEYQSFLKGDYFVRLQNRTYWFLGAMFSNRVLINNLPVGYNNYSEFLFDTMGAFEDGGIELLSNLHSLDFEDYYCLPSMEFGCGEIVKALKREQNYFEIKNRLLNVVPNLRTQIDLWESDEY